MATQTKNPLEKVTESEPVKTAVKGAKPFQKFLTKFTNDGTMTFAGTIAYNLIVTMIPILTALLAIIAFVLGKINGDALVKIQNQIIAIFPENLRSGITPIIHNASQQLTDTVSIFAIVALLTAIFGGSRLFIVIEQFFDLIYHLRPRTLVKQNLVAVVMLLLFILILPVMAFASAIPVLILSFAKSLTNFIPFIGSNPTVALILGTLGGILSGILAGFVLFIAIYIVMPNQKISAKQSWRGALVAAIALEAFLFAFPFYASNFLKGYVGFIGGAIILVLFFYYFAVILLLGAEINAFFSENVQPLPNDIITFVSTMAGRVNQDRPDLESSDHMDAKPTERADNERIGMASQGNQQTRHNSSPKQQQQATAKPGVLERLKMPKAAAPERIKTRKVSSAGPSATATVLEIAAGTALTVVIELLRLRKHGK